MIREFSGFVNGGAIKMGQWPSCYQNVYKIGKNEGPFAKRGGHQGKWRSRWTLIWGLRPKLIAYLDSLYRGPFHIWCRISSILHSFLIIWQWPTPGLSLYDVPHDWATLEYQYPADCFTWRWPDRELHAYFNEVQAFCWEVDVFNRSCFQSVSCKYISIFTSLKISKFNFSAAISNIYVQFAPVKRGFYSA